MCSQDVNWSSPGSAFPEPALWRRTQTPGAMERRRTSTTGDVHSSGSKPGGPVNKPMRRAGMEESGWIAEPMRISRSDELGTDARAKGGACPARRQCASPHRGGDPSGHPGSPAPANRRRAPAVVRGERALRARGADVHGRRRLRCGRRTRARVHRARTRSALGQYVPCDIPGASGGLRAGTLAPISGASNPALRRHFASPMNSAKGRPMYRS